MQRNNLYKMPNKEIPVSRVVILGGGFISGAVQKKLSAMRIEYVLLRSQDLDLTKPEAASGLRSILRPTDTVLFIAARAPVKSEAMLIENLLMAKSVCEAIREVMPSHMVYVSSDAVYSDSNEPLHEESVCSPDNLHGIMHLAREVMLGQIMSAPLCILRPTLVFGKEDPHNGYGPNRFVRSAEANEDIVLFGEGEERRDHVSVDDVAEVVVRSIYFRASGMLNVVSGRIVSFREIAETVVGKRKTESKILTSSRTMPMPHNGYREFDNSLLRHSFPDMEMTSVLDWIGEKG